MKEHADQASRAMRYSVIGLAMALARPKPAAMPVARPLLSATKHQVLDRSQITDAQAIMIAP